MNSAREALLAAARVCESLWDEHDKARAELHSSYHEGAADAAEECERRILALAEQQPAESMPHHASLWATVRTLAEGSDWKRDSGESLEQWAIRRIQRGAAARELPAVKSASRQHEGKADQHSHVTRDDPVHADAPPALVPVRDSAKQPAQSAPHPDPAGQEGCGLQGSKGFVPTVEQGQPALPGPETVSEQRLWLWKNFVDGKPEYFAFDNPFPCYGNGDPMTFGEPVGYAILKSSTRSRNAVDDEYELARLINRNRQEKSAAKETVSVPREVIEELLAWFDKPLVKHDQGLPERFRAMLAAGSANSKEQR